VKAEVKVVIKQGVEEKVKSEVKASVPYLKDSSKLFVRGLSDVNKIYVVTGKIIIKHAVR
jgi:hypothetical protein